VRRARHIGIVLAVAVSGAVACSNKKKAPSDELESCPPAPLEFTFEGRPCHGFGCPYASPNGLGQKWASTTACDEDTMGQCLQGKFAVTAAAVVCCPEGPNDITWCSQPITQGAPCNQPDNSECVLSDQSATCACDKPGPVWRCLPIDGGVQYCSCQDNGDCPLDAGADAADAG